MANSAEYFQIKCKSVANRIDLKSVPWLEKSYHKSMENGRRQETDVAEALHTVKMKVDEWKNHISTYMDINRLSTTCKFPDEIRPGKLVSDISHFMSVVNKYMQGVLALQNALQQNLQLLAMMKLNLFGMIQNSLNEIAALLNDICNWHLPNLPSLPNFFSGLPKFNGFNFTGLKPNIGFDTHFAFGLCHLATPNLDIFRNYPSALPAADGSWTWGAPEFTPPLGGVIQSSGSFAFNSSQITQTHSPVFVRGLNPFSCLQGSLPIPSTIISNYQLSPENYRTNVVSTIPALVPLVVTNDELPKTDAGIAARNSNIRNSLVQYVTLQDVVDSNYDPNLAAAWLFYVQGARAGRAGQWLPTFESVYETYIVPSLSYLATTPVPWNQALQEDDTQGPLNAAPVAIPLIPLMKADSSLLWKLSYVEAAILGYTRTQTWDDSAKAGYVDAYTGSDLDYRSTSVDLTQTTILVVGAPQASYPLQITYPIAIGTVLQEVIKMAQADITIHTEWRSSRPQFRFIYDLYAELQEIDRFSQFWREFNANLSSFLKEDPYIIGFVSSYPEALNSAINPLADSSIFKSIQMDANSRIRDWVPGHPLLAVPVAPQLLQMVDQLPVGIDSGWSNDNFDPATFMLRPDVLAQPIPVQMAMLQTNLSYAAVMKLRSDMQTMITTLQQDTQNLISTLNNVGFSVTADSVTIIPSGSAGADVAFGTADFDQTNFVGENPTEFTIAVSGVYAVSGTLNWDSGGSMVRIVTVKRNGAPVYVQSLPQGTGPTSLTFATLIQFEQGDILSVAASTDDSSSQNVLSGSQLSAILYPQDSGATGQVSTSLVESSAGIQNLIAEVSIPALTAVQVAGTGGVVPVDPTGTTVPFVDGITLADAGLGTLVQVGMIYGSVYVIPGTSFTPGGLLYVAADGSLTQDYNNLITIVPWVVCVGRAVSSNSILYAPHIPSKILQNF